MNLRARAHRMQWTAGHRPDIHRDRIAAFLDAKTRRGCAVQFQALGNAPIGESVLHRSQADAMQRGRLDQRPM